MKKLYKSRENRVISGVCGGIAEYFDVDPVLIRVIFVLFFFFGGSAILAYIIGMIIIPDKPVITMKKDLDNSVKDKEIKKRTSDPGKNSLAIGLILIILGFFFLMAQIPFLRIYYIWIKHNFWQLLFPIILILTGLTIIISNRKSD